MWLMLSDGFLSVVQPSQSDRKTFQAPDGDVLMVRARAAGQIEAYFPDAVVTETPSRDYRYRAFVARAKVAEVVAQQVLSLDYGNFKNSVSDNRLHDAYADVWSVMYRYQHDAASKRRAPRRGIV